jgi:hypothetical protein
VGLFYHSPGVYAWGDGSNTLCSPLPGGLPPANCRKPPKGDCGKPFHSRVPGVNAWAREKEEGVAFRGLPQGRLRPTA